MTDDAWAFTAPYLSLLPEDAGQLVHDLREVLNARRWLVKAGSPSRLLPHDFPPWPAAYQQGQRPGASRPWPTTSARSSGWPPGGTRPQR